MLRSWELRVVPPGTVGPPGPSKRNGDGETNRVDCVRTVQTVQYYRRYRRYGHRSYYGRRYYSRY